MHGREREKEGEKEREKRGRRKNEREDRKTESPTRTYVSNEEDAATLEADGGGGLK